MNDGRFKTLLTAPDDEIARRYNSGESAAGIAKEMSVGPQTVRRAIKRAGSSLRHKNSEIQKAMSKRGDRAYNYCDISNAYASGSSIPQVCEQFGCSSTTVIRALRETGTQARSIGEGISLAHRGNRRLDSGYITVCHDMNVRKKEHVLIAESVLGRPLKKGECVHHINQIKTDNRHDNLLICTIGYHSALHARMRRKQKRSNIKEV